MPWSGGAFTRTNGVHTGSTLWVQDRDAGTKILAARHDTHDQDLAGGINSTLEKSGSNAATGNLNIGSNRLTAVADGTAKTDAATVNQLQSNAPAFQATDTGTANAHVIALSPAITAYAAGQAITFKSGAASTTASTINVNGLGVKAIKKKNDQDIAAGDIESGSIVTVVYDGTNFQMTSQLATDDGLTIGGSNTQVQYNNSGALAGDADFTFDGSNVSLAKALYLADGAVATPSVANTGDVNTGIYFPAADTVGIVTGGVEQFRFGSNPIPGGSKNLIRNGAMGVAQRGTVTSPADQAYTLDGWQTRDNVGATITVSQDTTGIFAGIGGSPTCMKIDCTGAEAAVAASEFYVIRQKIETQNCDFLNYGQTDALAVTLSFNIQSPKSGTHTGVLGNNASSSRSYAFNFTVASADTPERVSVTIPGDTAGGAIGQGLTTEGLRLNIPLLCGADNAKAAGSWGAGIYEAASSTPNLLDNAANNIYLGDVQLEVGSVATDFAHQSYAEDLAACQRYLYLGGTGAVGGAASTSQVILGFQFPQVMRVAPTAALTDTSINVINTAGSGLASSGSAIDYSTIKKEGAMTRINGWSGGNAQVQHYPVAVYSQDPFIAFSAEL